METLKEVNIDSAKSTVLSFIDALNNEDFKSARNLTTDDLKFEGVMGTRDGADAYFADMEKMKLKYDVKKVFADEDEVAVFYDVKMSGENILCVGWYHLEEDKIRSFKVIFDPRPILR